MIATKQSAARPALWVGRLERARLWSRLGLGAALAVAALLNLWNLAQNGYANLYYSVAVQSMLQSWHNFFFAAYDAGGFISVDKPPVALWVQAISAKIFGFNAFALLLPEALAGVASVALVYYLVRRLFGPLAGTVAALALAVTPIAVAVNRDNQTDTLLMFTLLLAAWALTHAVEKGRLALLCLSLALVGVAFNIKMLEAFIVLPTFYLLYLLAAPRRWGVRLLHLGVGSGVLLAVSLAWAVAVDLTPPDQRPWVGGSQSNSVLELALGYNGLSRVTGNIQGGAPGGARPQGGFGGPGGNPALPPGGTNAGSAGFGGRGGFGGGTAGGPGGSQGLFGAGIAGPWRLFTGGVLAEQWSWLVPLALVGLLPAVLALRRRWPLERRGPALLLWTGWLSTYGVVFSAAEGTFHPYYLIMLAPAAAALTGIGVAALATAYRRGGRQAWLLPGALLLTAAWQMQVLAGYPQWAAWLIPVTLGGSLLAALPLGAARLLDPPGGRRLAPALVGVGLAGLLVAPLAWALTPVLAAPRNASLPLAGPSTLADSSSSWTQMDTAPDALVAYLQAHRAGAFYLVVVNNAQEASALTLASGRPVLAAAGFMGTDPALPPDTLAQMVAAGQVRFVLGLGSRGPGGSGTSATARWVQTHCTAVDASLYGGQATGGRGFGGAGGGFLSGLSDTLYDCAAP